MLNFECYLFVSEQKQFGAFILQLNGVKGNVHNALAARAGM